MLDSVRRPVFTSTAWRLSAFVEIYLVHAHLRHDGFGRHGYGVGNVVQADFNGHETSRQQRSPRIGIERPHGQRARGDIHLRFLRVDLRPEGLVPAFDRKRKRRSRPDLAGITLRHEEVDLERRNLRQLGHHHAGRGVGALADVSQTDNSVERRTQLRQRDIGLDDVDIGVEHRQLRTGLLIGLLTDGVLFEQRALAVNPVLGQLELRFVARQLRQQRFVVDLGQQFALADDRPFLEIDLDDLA